MIMAKLNELIRCEDAIKEICKRTCTPGVLCPDAYCKEVKEWITDDMVVDAVPVVHRRWIRVVDNNGQHQVCEFCGEWKYHINQKFCGECGARLDGKDEA